MTAVKFKRKGVIIGKEITLEVPGCLRTRNGRYSYKVKFPGDDKPTEISLVPLGQKFGTKDKALAAEIAKIIWNRKTDPENATDGTVEDLCIRYLADRKKYHTNGDGVLARQYHIIAGAFKQLRAEKGNDLTVAFSTPPLTLFSIPRNAIGYNLTQSGVYVKWRLIYNIVMPCHS